MSTQHPGNLLHRFDLRSHRARTPLVQEPARPVRREIDPEERELLLQQVGTDRAQVVLKQIGQLDLLLLSQILRALEQQPAGLGLGQHRLVPLGLQRPGLPGPYFVERLAQMRHDGEADIWGHHSDIW